MDLGSTYASNVLKNSKDLCTLDSGINLTLFFEMFDTKDDPMFTRGGGLGGQKNRVFGHFYTIENVNGGG